MKSYAKNLLLIVCSLLIVLVISELFLRIAGYKVVTFYPFSGFHQFDADLGWTQIPGHEAVFQGREFKVNIKTNSHGYSDKDYPFTKPAGSERVVVLGDSFTWGWGVEQEEIFCEVAEKNLERVEFINLGQTAYSTAQEYLLFKKLGMKFSPNFTILAFGPNDIMENSENPKRPKFLVKDGMLELENSPIPLSLHEKIKKFLKDHFLLYSLIDYRYVLLRQFLKPSGKRPNGYDWVPDYFFKSYHEKMQGPWDVTKALLLEIDKLTDHRFLIMYIPNRLQVEEETYQQAVLTTQGRMNTPFDESLIDLFYPNKLLQEFSEEQGIPFLDLTSYFRKENKQHSLYFKYDGHWTMEGHRLAGKLLSERIQKLL